LVSHFSLLFCYYIIFCLIGRNGTSSIEEGKYKTQDSNILRKKNFGIFSTSGQYYSRLYNSTFKDVTFLDKADFSKISLESRIIFENVTFEKTILFSWKNLTSIHFDNVNFKEAIDFTSFILKSCKFINTVFENKINFEKATFNILNFENSTFKHKVSFKDGKINGNSNFKNVIFEKGANFQKQKFKQANSTDRIDFSDGKYGVIDFSNSIIDMNIKITDSKFKSIIWRNTTLSKTTNCIIRNIETDEFILDYYNSESEEKVLFDFVKINNILKINYVNFNEEKFNQLNLTSAIVEIENSSFNNNFFNSIKWGTVSEHRYKASRDIFRQLKFYSEQQKNFIDADAFYSLEMKERKKELREESRKLKRFEWIKHFFTDTAVFYIHEKTSNFSQNWLLPIIWLFLLGMIGIIFKNFNISILSENIYFLLPASILLFLLPLIYKKYEKIKKFIAYWYLFIPTIALYIAFSKDKLDDIAIMINPSKIFISVSSTTISGEFIYLLYKIAVLFLVYQVIIAMKKKVRSK